MPNNLYIADLHLGHKNIIAYDPRPFRDVDEMQSVLVENWNSAVKRNDTVYILGDMFWKKEPREWVDVLSRLKGTKVLIRGNHDPKQFSEEVNKMFASVSDYKEIVDDGRKVILCHYPILMYNCSFQERSYMLCGHVHTTVENELLEKYKDEIGRMRARGKAPRGQIYNVGCMMPWMDYTPRTLDEIIEGYVSWRARQKEGQVL